MELENLSIEKLKKLNFQELEDLASKMKEFMIDSTALTGGHIGANLSSLEISIALHKVLIHQMINFYLMLVIKLMLTKL